LAVRLFIGNLPYGASEADLRAHFAAVAEPSHVVMPVDRETGRPRGFAFVEFTERAAAEEVIKRFDQQPFQGRSLAVSEARAREDRPPGGYPPRAPGAGGGFGGPRPGGGGFSGPRPGGGGFGGPRPGGSGFGGPRPVGAASAARARVAVGSAVPRWVPAVATAAPTSVLRRRPKRLRAGKKGGNQQENRPRGPIKEKSGGRIYAVDDLEDDNRSRSTMSRPVRRTTMSRPSRPRRRWTTSRATNRRGPHRTWTTRSVWRTGLAPVRDQVIELAGSRSTTIT
jgi:RNA recognition motif-containing protein